MYFCCDFEVYQFMKKFISIFLSFLILSIVTSCGLKKDISVNANYEPTIGKIPIVQTNQSLPTNIYRIGSIVVGESGLTPSGDCSYEACMRTIEDESRKVGAQLVYIVKVVEPNYNSTCYNITAELYRYDGN